jgi:hypothetical protein
MAKLGGGTMTFVKIKMHALSVLDSLLLTFFLHTLFFLLLNTQSNSATITGSIEDMEHISEGVVNRAIVNVQVKENVNGHDVVKRKQVSILEKNLSEIQFGKNYSIKTVNGWVVSYSKI